MKVRARMGSLAICVAMVSLSLPAYLHPATPLRFLETTNPVRFSLNPSDVSPVTTYEWRTLPGSDDPAEVRVILLSTHPFNSSFNQTLTYIRTVPNAPEWSAWMPYLPPGVGMSWTSPPMDLGTYVFAVQGRDATGVAEPEIDETRNALRIRIANRVTGPSLTVTGDMISPINANTTTTPLTEVTVAGGTPVSFCWTADASQYGGVVSGYRYAWDITDPDDDSQWGTDFIPLPAQGVCSSPETFLLGQHLFTVEVVDNTGHKSRVPILVHVDPASPVEPTTWGRVKALYADDGSARP